MVSIFCLGRCEKVGLSLGPNVARSEIYTEGSLDISTNFGVNKIFMGRLVWLV